jgi:hypothetical protein
LQKYIDKLCENKSISQNLIPRLSHYKQESSSIKSPLTPIKKIDSSFHIGGISSSPFSSVESKKLLTLSVPKKSQFLRTVSVANLSIPSVGKRPYSSMFSNKDFQLSLYILQLLYRRWIAFKEMNRRRSAAMIITRAARRYLSRLYLKQKIMERKFIAIERKERLWFYNQELLRISSIFVEKSCYNILVLNKVTFFIDFFRFIFFSFCFD